MRKIKTARELVKIIQELDLLEAIVHEIDRSDTPSVKKSALNQFSREAQKQINEERDVLLMALKVK